MPGMQGCILKKLERVNFPRKKEYDRERRLGNEIHASVFI